MKRIRRAKSKRHYNKTTIEILPNGKKYFILYNNTNNGKCSKSYSSDIENLRKLY